MPFKKPDLVLNPAHVIYKDELEVCENKGERLNKQKKWGMKIISK